MDGLGFAPMGFWLSMLISMLVIKLLMGYLGFKTWNECDRNLK